MSAGGSSASYSMMGAANCINESGGSAGSTANFTVMGTLTWTIQWTPSFDGDPVPENVSANLQAYGHDYLQDSGGGVPADTCYLQSSISDLFLVDGISSTGSHKPVTAGSTTDSYANLPVETGGFTSIGGGVYQGTIQYSVNVASYNSASISGPVPAEVAAAVNAQVQLKPTSIDGQPL